MDFATPDLIELLNDTTVSITLANGIATGFWVGPGLALTCAHVVEEAYANNAQVVLTWRGIRTNARIADFLDPVDLALLEVEDMRGIARHPCALLSAEVVVGDKLYGFGYTETYKEGEPFTPEVEGLSRAPSLVKLKLAQVIPGFSGAPLLNLRTGGVCGIARKTRDRNSDLGGRATPISVAFSSFRTLPDIQAELRRANTVWSEALTPTQKALLGLSPHSSSLKSRVAELYRLLHYSVVTDKPFNGRTVDHFIQRRVGDFSIQRAIGIFPGEVTVDHIDSFLSVFRLVRQSLPAAQATIVSSHRFTPDIQSHAQAEGIQLTHINDLEGQLFDGQAYASRLRDEVQDNPRYDIALYIEPEVADELHGKGTEATVFLNEWLDDPSRKQLTILGDVGTGKTFLTRILSHRMAKEFLDDPLGARLPVHIDLRNADRQISLQALVLSHLADAGLSDVTFDVFMHALSHGRILLILDGFDEMAAKVTPQITERNFQELARAVTGQAKVLLTCRTHYFRSRSEEEEVVLGDGGDGSEFAKELYWDLISRKGFGIAYLRPFNLTQIESYVALVKGKDAPEAISKIRAIYNLEELCQRPLLLEMIVKSIDKIDASKISPAALYQVFTDAWIHRDKWRDILTPDEKLDFLMGLARSLFMEECTAVHHSRLTQHLRQELAAKVHNDRQLVEMDNEIRTASFLTRDDQGNYGFAHKSYREFFFARYLHSQLRASNIVCLRVSRLSPEVCGFIVDLTESEDIAETLSTALLNKYEPFVSENALVLLYAIRRGRIDSHVDPRTIEIRLPDGMQLEAAQLNQVNLEGAIAPRLNLRGASLNEAVLAHMYAPDAILERANLQNADLRRVVLNHANCQAAMFIGANLEGASLKNAILSNSNLTDAGLAGVRVDNADLSELMLGTVKLPGICFAPSTKGILLDVIRAQVPAFSALGHILEQHLELIELLRMQLHTRYRHDPDVDDIVQDAIQDALEKLWRRGPAVEAESNKDLLNWLFRAAQLRVRAIRQASQRLISVDPNSDLLQELESRREQSPDAALLIAEMTQLLEEELSDEMMQLLRAKVVDELSNADIAERFGMSQEAVRKKFARVRQHIRNSARIQRLIDES